MKNKNLSNLNPTISLVNEFIKPITSSIKGIIKTKIQEGHKTNRKALSVDEEKIKTAINSVKEVGKKALESSTEITKHSINSSIEIAKHSMNSSIESNKENIKHIANTTERAYQHTENMTEKTLNQYEGMIEKEKEEKTNFLNIQKEQNKENLKLSKNISSLKAEVLGLKIKEEIEKNIYAKLYNKQQILIELKKEKKRLTFIINEKVKELNPLNDELNKIIIDLKISTSHFKKENIEFEKKIENIEKLIFEYKNILDIKDYKNILQKEKRELNKIENNISNYEYKMLNSELMRLTKEKKQEPIKNEIQELKKKKFLIKIELDNMQNVILNPALESYTISNKSLGTNIIDVEIEKN